MKNLLKLLIILLPFCAAAQETTIRKNRLTETVVEHITVLKTDKNMREGLYEAILDKQHPIAIGKYHNNQKTGTWNFYDPHSNMLQRYDYTNKKLLYEAPEDTSSFCRYFVDYSLSDTDKVTKPIRIGDRYYGYINYLKLFTVPPDLPAYISYNNVAATVELLISPGGRLADFNVHLQALGYDQKIGINMALLSEDDKTYIPATLNGKPVTCQIMLRCFITENGKLDVE